MTLKAKLCSLGIMILFSSLAWAEDPNTDDGFAQHFKNIGFNVGALTEFYNAIQTDTRGQKNKIDLDPMIGFSTDVELNKSWAVIPELNWVLPREAGDKITRNLFMLRLDGGWKGGEWWRLRVGTSFMVNNIRGQGGTKAVRNGGGTSDFYIPPESKTSVNNTLDFGAELLYDAFSFRLQSYTYALFKSERRQVSYSLLLTYYYDLEK